MNARPSIAPDAISGGIVARPPPDTKLIAPGGSVLAKASTGQLFTRESPQSKLTNVSERVSHKHNTMADELDFYSLVRRCDRPPICGIFMMTTFPINKAKFKKA